MQGTQTGFKNQLLFERFGINYNQLPEQFKKVRSRQHSRTHCSVDTPRAVTSRLPSSSAPAPNRPQTRECCCVQGSVVTWQASAEEAPYSGARPLGKRKQVLTVQHVDLIQDAFWESNPDLLA